MREEKPRAVETRTISPLPECCGAPPFTAHPMTEPTPAAAAPETQKTITISLHDMAQRYLGAMQRTHDIAAMVVQGTREVNERGYYELAAAARFMPAQNQRRAFAAAKPVAERWLLRNLLADAFGSLVPFLEDTRTICALHAWKKAGSDPATLEPIFKEQRADFVRKDTAARLAHLKETYQLELPLSAHVTGLEALAACLVRHDGLVPKDGTPLAFQIVALDLVGAQQGDQRTVQPQLGESRKEFAPGSEVALDKVEYLNVLATVALFMNAALRKLQEMLSATPS
jgi:hypothetical protein